MGSQITPGPCLSGGCPPPTEIVCIEVTKVYDSCFQAETLPATAMFNGPCAVASGGCTVTGTSCALVSSTPAASPPNPPTPITPVFFNLTFNVAVSGTVTVVCSGDGTISSNWQVSQLQTVTLFAPSGVSTQCEITADCQITSLSTSNETTTVNITVDICEVFKTIFEAQLLVPAYGFCTPSPCSVSPLVCPPVPPPQLPGVS